jgi:Ribbon-helix-helix protein, copG family
MMADLKRTNIYLTEEQWRAFAVLHLEDGRSASEHIRRALDAYLAMRKRGDRTWSPRQGTLVRDAEGYVHGTISGIYEEHFHNDDHDVARLAWSFSAPVTHGIPFGHDLWTGITPDYHPMPGIHYVGHTPRPNLLARLLLALRVVTDDDFLTHRADAILADFDLESLVGTSVRYRTTTIYNLYEPPPEGYDPVFDPSEPPWYQEHQGPDIDTLTRDESLPQEKETS